MLAHVLLVQLQQYVLFDKSNWEELMACQTPLEQQH